jgi:valyl-tRNA synthetase
VADVDRALGEYAFADVTRLLYDATWSDYCDWAIELAKVRLGDPALEAADREATWWTMVEALDTYLRLLHPVIPFVTEAIWGELPHAEEDPDLLIVARWPEPGGIDPVGEAPVAAAIDLVRAIRNARSEARNEPAAWLPVHVTASPDLAVAWDALAPAIERLGRARPLVRVASAADLADARVPGSLAAIAGTTEAVVQPAAGGGAGADRERARLERELVETEALLASARARLANPSFVEKAPRPVVEGARAREAELADLAAKLRERLGD